MNLVNILLDIAGTPLYIKLVKASYKPGKSAESTLRKILAQGKDTVYGREQHFEEILKAKNPEDLFRLYRENVPANGYEELRPYVDRHKNGEENILFKGKPVMYATTSGTTDNPKWVPITKPYLKNVYSKMSRMWLYSLVVNKPEITRGRFLTIVGKDIEGYAPDGTVYGSVSGITRKDVPGFISKKLTCPGCVYNITDYQARYYTIMRMSVEQSVTVIATPNPSTLVELQNNAQEWWDEYVKDIENGTLSDKMIIEPEIREELKAYLKPNPERAAELRELKEKYGTPLPKHYWPDMQILNTWKCGNTKLFLDKVLPDYPEDVLKIEIGYFATECRFGVVLDRSLSTVLVPHFHYYEFVEESDLDKQDKTFYQIDQLIPGKRYCPYVTTYSGLYRYNMNDLVECDGWFKNTPTVHMVQKVNGIVSITGEKLYEKQFIEAVHEAQRVTGLKCRFFIGFANPEEANYDFFYEFLNSSTSKERAEEFTKFVDLILKKKNMEYESKRDSGRLKHPKTHILGINSFEKFKARSLKEGARDGQFKLIHLMQDRKRQEKFNDLEIKD